MTNRSWIAMVVVLAACSPTSAPPAVHVGPIERWEPVDPTFAGCQGACGAHVEGERADIVAQPGALVGDRTYCPVSGAVFEVDADHPRVEIGRRTLWFCCAACAAYFREHREEVLRARGLDASGNPRTASGESSGPAGAT